MDWQTRRKVLYALATSFLLISFVVFIFRNTLFPTPTCFDKKQNGFELGVDCGGTCSLRCTEDITPLSVKWSRSINIAPNTYDLVALISNKNIDNSSHSLGYSFTVYSAKDEVIETYTGTTVVPVNGDFPIIIQKVTLREAPKYIDVKLSDTPHFIVYEDSTAPTLRVFNERFESGNISRVYATIINTRRLFLSNVQVRVVLYDNDNNAFAVGETIIPSLDKEENKEVSFIWNTPLPQNTATIRVYPIFDPFLLVP